MNLNVYFVKVLFKSQMFFMMKERSESTGHFGNLKILKNDWIEVENSVFLLYPIVFSIF